VIAVCAVICGAEGWVDVELFGKSKGGIHAKQLQAGWKEDYLLKALASGI